ncbi:hypothetical protein ACFSC3_05620 [Sphingomonas floccifaciens]|uniref:Uncharacterized protein n=1 Tax=Sphingomonas floccifaciens TaxID=1844115 RepID=A0ABW4NAH0_9SPHN
MFDRTGSNPVRDGDATVPDVAVAGLVVAGADVVVPVDGVVAVELLADPTTETLPPEPEPEPSPPQATRASAASMGARRIREPNAVNMGCGRCLEGTEKVVFTVLTTSHQRVKKPFCDLGAALFRLIASLMESCAETIGVDVRRFQIGNRFS